ncbi:MAG: hypothetical protein ACE37F_13635 [Nannocystaceae bacterium]|nr:hypothetical protein [bacterium]
MDPITLALLATLAVAAATGGTVATVRARRQTRREAMRAAVRAPVPIGHESPISLFDVFWDLGASDLALTMMAHRGVLLERPEDKAKLVHTLGEEVVRSGGRAAYVAEQLEAIEEVFRKQRSAGTRALPPALAAPDRKMLPAASDAVAYANETPVGLAKRDAWRSGGQVGPLDGGGSDDIDIDAAVGTDGQALLRILFAGGSMVSEARRWFAMRQARTLRDQLDGALTKLHADFVAHVRHDAAALGNLHDSGRRWEAEVTRLEALHQADAGQDAAWAVCAEVLIEESMTLARALAVQAHANVQHTLARIDELAASGQVAMAGYLVYVNRYAFFAGRTALAEASIVEVESALGRLGTELQRLRRDGVL